ncbi:hypothetical protein AL046_14190 [Pseudomonas syringae pv. avii]|nr:hypothetical protein AL046_14190 [Pseudomonas syringae pv. avii]
MKRLLKPERVIRRHLAWVARLYGHIAIPRRDVIAITFHRPDDLNQGDLEEFSIGRYSTTIKQAVDGFFDREWRLNFDVKGNEVLLRHAGAIGDFARTLMR